MKLPDKMQVTIFKNINNEINPSMHLYAEELLKYMPSNVKGFSIDAPDLPILKYYLAKEIVYPKIAARNQTDVNHISDHSYCGLLRRLNPERTVVTCHDLTPLLYPQTVSKAGRIRYWFNIRLLPEAKRIITSSQFIKKAIIQIFRNSLENKIRIIPYGVSEIFKPLNQKNILKSKYNITGKSILHIGSSYRHKNIDIILKFMKTHNKYQLVKIGPFLKTHKKYILKHGLQRQILHFPYVDIKQLQQIYNCAGVLVVPSLYEGFGLPILEAIACGCPVVCSDIPPFREIAEDTAVFFNPDSAESLEAALESIFDDESFRNKLIENGLSVAQRYSWKKCADETYRVYEEIYRKI